MIRIRDTCALGVAFIAISVVDWATGPDLKLDWIPEAQAIVGRPLTPVSVAGVARRTTRRAIAVESTAVAASAATSAALPAAPPAAPTPAAVPAAGALPLGTVVPSLPSGCTQMTSGGVQYYRCGADYYRTAFQGTNLVYVTAQP